MHPSRESLWTRASARRNNGPAAIRESERRPELDFDVAR